MKNQEVQRCPHVNFLSQLKHSPLSRRLAISAGVRHFKGTNGGLGGVGNKGRVREEGEGREKIEGLGGGSGGGGPVLGAGRPRGRRRVSTSFSFWSRANLVVRTMVSG